MAGQMEGSVAIVTGSGRGIGRAIARAYAREGASVVLASRTLGRVEEVAKEIEDEGGNALPISCDVGEPDQIASMVERTVAELGTVHVLVNNAQGFGTAKDPAPSTVYAGVEEVEVAFVTHSFRTGALASLWGMQAVFPHMKAQGWGKIINFSSTSGLLGTTGNAPYNMTKEAIRALSRTAANEWGQHGINVNVISPTLRTGAFEAWEVDRPEFVRALRESLPMRRLGEPERDAGPLAVFLATHASDYMTGQTFMLNGGKVML